MVQLQLSICDLSIYGLSLLIIIVTVYLSLAVWAIYPLDKFSPSYHLDQYLPPPPSPRPTLTQGQLLSKSNHFLLGSEKMKLIG